MPCAQSGAREFFSVYCVPPCTPVPQSRSLSPPCGRVLLLVILCKIYFGREVEGFPCPGPVSAQKSCMPLASPGGGQTLPCICWGLGGRFLSVSQWCGIMQILRSRMVSCCSPKGKEFFPSFSQPRCVVLCPGADSQQLKALLPGDKGLGGLQSCLAAVTETNR